MAIFITLRCERRGAGLPSYHEHCCWSDSNDDPFVLEDETKAAAGRGVSILFADARKAGWVRKSGEGWVCPACLAYENNQAEEAL